MKLMLRFSFISDKNATRKYNYMVKILLDLISKKKTYFDLFSFVIV